VQVAVIGAAGNEGSGIVKDLLSKWSEGINKVIMVDKNLERLEKMHQVLGDARIVIKIADATNKTELVKALEGINVCINAANYNVNLNVMEACLAAKTPYLDLGGMFYVTLEQKKLHEKFVKKGVPAILGMGSAPGCTNILAKYAADQLDTVKKVNLYDGMRFFGQKSLVFIPPYSIRTLLQEFSEESVQFIGGEFKKMPPCSGAEVIEFPEPVGKVECVYTLHSEIATLPYTLKDKGVKEVTWKLGLPDEVKGVAVSLASVGFGVVKEIKINDEVIKSADFLETIIQINIKENLGAITQLENSQSYEVIRARVIGETNSKEVEYIIDLIKEPQKDYEGINDPITAMPASIVAQMLAREEIPPGVWAPEEQVNCAKFFDEMSKRKFKINVRKMEMFSLPG